METDQSEVVSNATEVASDIMPAETAKAQTSNNNVTMDMIEKLLADKGENSFEETEIISNAPVTLDNATLPAIEVNTENLDLKSKLLTQTNNKDSQGNKEVLSSELPKDKSLTATIKTEPNDETFSMNPNGDQKNAPESFASVRVKSEKESKSNLVGNKNFIIKSSLGLLAQYDSDTDEDENEVENSKAKEEDDDVMEIPMEANKDYRNKVVEIDSDSDDSSSSSDSDVEYIAKMRKEIEKTMEFDDDDEAEEDDEDNESAGGKNKKKKSQNSMRVKGELTLDDLPPIEDLKITVPEDECIILGRIHSIVDQLLLVSALPDSTLYDLDTVLFLEKGKKVLGTVFDVLGQVADPLYCVRFNSHEEIEEKGLKVGDAVYVAPKTEHTQFVILSNLMKMRGSDASWENDVEPPPRYLDYSDDEQEREARHRIRNKDRSANRERDDNQDDAAKRARDEIDDDTASVSSAMSTNSQQQNNYVQRGGGGGRNNRRGQNQRTPHNVQRYQRNAQHAPHQSQYSNAGSWHSNYNRPNYNYNQSPIRMPPMPLHMQMPNSMPSSYQLFPTYPQFQPTMNPSLPPLMQTPPPMYVQNPYAIRPPQFSQPPQQTPHSTQTSTRSHSPPPPGLE